MTVDQAVETFLRVFVPKVARDEARAVLCALVNSVDVAARRDENMRANGVDLDLDVDAPRVS